MEIKRAWSMPSANTFEIQPIKAFVEKYLRHSEISVDPFSRDSNLATWTNDLNPETAAKYHMKALDFLKMLRKQGVRADLIIFDPPYSKGQAKEVYQNFGAKQFTQEDAQSVGNWQNEKRICNDILIPGGVFLHFGWHTNGVGRKHGYEIIDILLVAHGGAHNDTICMAQRKRQTTIFDALTANNRLQRSEKGGEKNCTELSSLGCAALSAR